MKFRIFPLFVLLLLQFLYCIPISFANTQAKENVLVGIDYIYIKRGMFRSEGWFYSSIHTFSKIRFSFTGEDITIESPLFQREDVSRALGLSQNANVAWKIVAPLKSTISYGDHELLIQGYSLETDSWVDIPTPKVFAKITFSKLSLTFLLKLAVTVLLICMLVLAPGYFIFNLLFKNLESDVKTCFAPVFSTFILGLIGLSHLIVQPWIAAVFVFLIVIFSIVYVFYSCYFARQRCSRHYLFPIGLLFSLSFIISLYLCFDTNTSTIQTAFQQKEIERLKTLSGFVAHDHLFQYVNAVAIADNLPFSEFYGQRRLVYEVQDREILPGLAFTGLRTFYSHFIDSIDGKSFGLYQLFAIVLNMCAILPVWFYIRRYFNSLFLPTLAVIGLFSTTAFFVHAFYAWFKLAGAGFVLTGLYVLLSNTQLKRSWILSGFAFGIAANFHASNLLGLPFVLFPFLFVKNNFYGHLKTFQCCFITFLVTILLYSPWSLVKKLYFPDTSILFKTHYLDGVNAHNQAGLIESAKLFFARDPLETQLERRFASVSTALRVEKVIEVYDTVILDWKEGLRLWNFYEFQFLGLILSPWLLILLISSVSEKGFQALKSNVTLFFSITGIITLIALHYSSMHLPDISYHLPLYLIILCYLEIFRTTWSGNLVGKIFLLTLFSVGFTKIALHSFFLIEITNGWLPPGNISVQWN